MVLKVVKSENIYKICAKILCNGYKTTFMKNALNIQSIQEKILPIIFCAVRSTKHFVDRVSADYNGYYMQESGKSDNYGFTGTCLIWTQRG